MEERLRLPYTKVNELRGSVCKCCFDNRDNRGDTAAGSKGQVFFFVFLNQAVY